MSKKRSLTAMALVAVVLLCSHRALGYGLWEGSTFVGDGDLTGSQGKYSSGSLEYTIESSLDATVGGVTAAQWNTAITTALGTWDAEVPFTFELDGVLTENDITFNAGPLDVGTWAEASSANVITFNTNMAWTPTLAQAVALHETGHVLGLDDMYTKATTPADTHYFGLDLAGSPYGHNAVPGTLATHGNADNNIPVMYGHLTAATAPGKLSLKADDIAGVRWLYGSKNGSSVACIDITGDNDVESNMHHGDHSPGIWTYCATVVQWDGGSGLPVVTLFAGTDAERVLGATIYNVDGTLLYSETLANPLQPPTGWDIVFLSDRTAFYCPVNFEGDLKIKLNSSYHEEKLIDWGVGANVNSAGQTFGPVPEPATLGLLTLGGLGLLRRRRNG